MRRFGSGVGRSDVSTPGSCDAAGAITHVTSRTRFLFQQKHSSALCRCSLRRLQAGRTGTDDDDIGVQVLLVE